ncbi:hypothetical protein LCGC14_0282170 [marine sediment metagenome]|uniref:DUF559 domain-containing protein n=1 Tax=marine sediment metagenome TaxID=412755 RepID=A0A0F9X0W3_9ZZZZ
MRLSNADVDKLLSENKLNPSIARQIKQAQTVGKEHSKKVIKKLPVPTESKGEATVRIALMQAFGDWFDGGEIVCEYIPFESRRYRADFALPRYRIYIEVDGWSHHGAHLDAHHSDRERGLFFSQHDWLPFRVSHKQATQSPSMLTDALAGALQLRTPLDRESLKIEKLKNPETTYTRPCPVV